MKLVAPQGLTLPQQQPVLTWRHPAVAHLEPTSMRAERQQSCHGMRRTVEIVQLLTQQQHAAAFGVNRTSLGKCPKGGQADAALPQLLSVLFRKAAGQDQPPGIGGKRFIGEGTPGQQGHGHAFQQFACLGVAKVKGLIRRHRHR